MMNTSSGKWGFDSNILVYAFNKDSGFYEKSRVLLEYVFKSGTALYLTHQNILETERVLIQTYKFPKKKVMRDIESFLDAFDFTLITPLSTTIYYYHKLLTNNKPKNIFDLYLAATYLDNGVNQIFTANEKDFVGIPRFKAVNPYKKGF
ncbi:PIN domain-containing protein [Patescibacteria group bacterium]|nr:PIN domain-containing protein [Patescibacteria group bacterium]